MSSKYRNWTFLVYPESMPSDWVDILNEYHIPWVCSPLHEFDVNSDGTPKKAHYHVVVMFHSPRVYNGVVEMVDKVCGARPEPVNDIRGMIRYLVHLDNPNKYQYDIDDVCCYNGADVDRYFMPSSKEVRSILRDIFVWCKDYNVTEFSDLIDYAIKEHYDDWYPLCVNSRQAYVLNSFLRSKRFA